MNLVRSPAAESVVGRLVPGSWDFYTWLMQAPARNMSREQTMERDSGTATCNQTPWPAGKQVAVLRKAFGGAYWRVRRQTLRRLRDAQVDLETRWRERLFLQRNRGITVPLMYGVGNKLLQYCFGRILAEETRLRMDAMYVASPHDASLERPMAAFVETFGVEMRVDGNTRSGIPKILNSRWMTAAGSGGVESLIEDAAGRRPLVVYGQFFRYAFLKPYKHRIRNAWIKLGQRNRSERPDTTLCVHMRLGDVARLGCHLNESYYERAIRALDWDELVVVSDEPDHPIVRGVMKRFGGRLAASNHWPTDFAFISSHKRIVTCESTFSWWAAWLSEAEVIVAPGPKIDRRKYGGRSWFNEKCNPRVDDEDRYIYIE